MVIAWAETQLGTPYAAIGRYRFGNPTWPGGTLTGDRGRVYTFPAGTAVYDYSGFVIAAYAQAGLDFRNQGIWGSQAFKTPAIPEAPRDNLPPGEIAVYAPDTSGIGHVVIVHHVELNGVVKTIEASVSYGVHLGTLSWTKVTAIKRPTLPPPYARST